MSAQPIPLSDEAFHTCRDCLAWAVVIYRGRTHNGGASCLFGRLFPTGFMLLVLFWGVEGSARWVKRGWGGVKGGKREIKVKWRWVKTTGIPFWG